MASERPLGSTPMNRKPMSRRQRNKSKPPSTSRQQPPTPPPSDNRQSIQATSRKVSFSSGPIPPPEILKGYEQTLPGAADRIIAMAEKETNHRHDMEKSTSDKEFREARTGQVLGFLIGCLIIIAGVVMAILGKPWTGAAIVGGAVIGLVIAFIIGRQENPPTE